jgi:hypothetical protein
MAGLKEGSRAYEKTHHGHQMEIQVLTRAPMNGRNYQTSNDIQKEWLVLQRARFEPRLRRREI